MPACKAWSYSVMARAPNKENRFTGWTDVGLSEQGVQEALEAGRVLGQEGYVFDVAYTSVLKRAIKTLWLVLEEMDLMWLPCITIGASMNGTTAPCRASTRRRQQPGTERHRSSCGAAVMTCHHPP